MNLNEMSARVHAANKKWLVDLQTGEPITRNRGNLLMLVITELAEAVEGIRKNLMDDKIPSRKMEEVEMADTFIRLLDFAAGFKQVLHELPWGQDFINNVPEDKGEAILQICDSVLNIYHHKNSCGMAISVAILNIRVYCAKHGLDLMGAYEAKMLFNATRLDHTAAHRLTEHGKRF